jgi:hypothetical protein
MKPEEKYTKHNFKRLYFEIGSKFDHYQTIEIIHDKNKLKLLYDPHKNISSADKLIIISIKDYQTFFNELQKINIENWDNNYPHKLYTGYNWKLRLYFRYSMVYEKEGSNNYPNNFIQLIRLIKYYFSKFEADIETKITLTENDLLKLYCTHHT